MKIFLHIGMPKTGSTTIQRTLLLNNSRLARAGVYYPYRNNLLYGLVTGTDPGPAISIPKRCHTVIISDERLFNRVRSPAHAEIIADALREISPDVHLISYVRREDEVFVSTYFTRLLMGGTERLGELPLNPVQTYKRLRSWKTPFPPTEMSIRRFGEAYFRDDLFTDFAKVVGIDHLPLEQAPVANSSPRCDVLEIIRLLNASSGEGAVDRQALKAVARAVGFGERAGLSQHKRKILIDRAVEHDRRLSRHFFEGEQVFSHPLLDDEPRWPEIGIEDLAKVGERMAEIHRIAIERPPAGLEDGLLWMRALAEKCARVSPFN